MTDREPDDLYDALRDRLADYGQEPPAPVWAGIRAQLPRPVAVAQRRRRRRVAVLALLLLLVSVGSWQWWQMGRKAGQRGTEMAANPSPNPAASGQISSETNGIGSRDDEAITSPRVPNTAGRLPESAHAANTVSTPAFPGATTQYAAETVAARASRAAAARGKLTVRQPAIVAGKPAAMREAAHLAAATTPIAARPATAVADEASIGREPGHLGRHQAASRSRVGSPTKAVAAAKPGKNTSAEESAAKAVAFGQKSRRAFFAGRPATGRAIAKNATATQVETPDIAAAQRSSSVMATRLAEAPAASGRAFASRPNPVVKHRATTGPATDSTVGSPLAVVSFAEWSQLQPRLIALNVWPLAMPTVRADTFPHPAASAVRRWTVQVLAGPALTYRMLGSGLSAAAVQSTAPNYFDANGNATSVTQQERPAVGFGAQVQLRRVLSGRWSFGTGLGYQEYATGLDFKTVQVAAFASSPVTSQPQFPDSSNSTSTAYHLRNTYRFLTIPVRFGYQLGVGGPRFRFGVLAGADVAFYLGGATAEGSVCGCETQTWGRTGSPYRPVSVALNLGLDLRYRVAPRWEVLAQPTVSFFTTSLVRPGRSLVPRYLLGSGVQLGMAYGLH